MADSYLRVTNMKQIHTSGLMAWHIYSYFRVTNMRQIHTSGLQTWQIHTSGLQTWDRITLQGYKHGRFILQGYKHETDSYFRVRNMRQIHTSTGLKTWYRSILQGYSHVTESYFEDTDSYFMRVIFHDHNHETDSYSGVTNMMQIHTSGLYTWNRFMHQGYKLIHSFGLQTGSSWDRD